MVMILPINVCVTGGSAMIIGLRAKKMIMIRGRFSMRLMPDRGRHHPGSSKVRSISIK